MDWLFDLPTWLSVAIILVIEFGIIALVIWVLGKLGVNVFSRFPKAAWIQGLKNAFFTLLILVAVVGGIALVPIVAFHQSIKSGFTISFWTIGVVILCWFYVMWLTNKQRAGDLLLDILPIPNKPIFFVMGILGIVVGFWGYADFIWDGTKYSWLISIITGLVAGMYFVIMGSSRIQIHKNGILAYVDLIRWTKIESFEWTQDDEKLLTLKLRYKGSVPAFLRNGAIPVPHDKKVAVDSFLKLNVPNPQNSA